MMNNKKCLVVGNNCREATMAYNSNEEWLYSIRCFIP